MRKHWVAMLSMLGLAGSVAPVQSQVLKGSTSQGKTEHNTAKTVNGNNTGQKAGSSSKLGLSQQTLRQQNQGNTSVQLTKGSANTQLTPPPPGQQITKDNAQITKGNAQITKGNAQITKGNAQMLTKGNAQITKGNQAITKGNQAVTKATVTK